MTLTPLTIKPHKQINYYYHNYFYYSKKHYLLRLLLLLLNLLDYFFFFHLFFHFVIARVGYCPKKGIWQAEYFTRSLCSIMYRFGVRKFAGARAKNGLSKGVLARKWDLTSTTAPV